MGGIQVNKQCQKYDVEFNQIDKECLRLTDYGVTIRYPYSMEVNETDMKLAIHDSDTLKKFVLIKVDVIKTKLNDHE